MGGKGYGVERKSWVVRGETNGYMENGLRCGGKQRKNRGGTSGEGTKGKKKIEQMGALQPKSKRKGKHRN